MKRFPFSISWYQPVLSTDRTSQRCRNRIVEHTYTGVDIGRMLALPVFSSREIVDIIATYSSPAGDQRLLQFQCISQCCSATRLGLQPDLFTNKFDQLEPDLESTRAWNVQPPPKITFGQSSFINRREQ